MERIKSDCHFFEEMEAKLQWFFVLVIISRVSCGTSTVDAHPIETSGVLCYCQKGKVGDMLLCDSPSCQYGWLCVTLSSVPTGVWFCPDCRQ